MLVFAHTGLTLGAAALLAGLTASRRSADIEGAEAAVADTLSSGPAAAISPGSGNRRPSWFEVLARRVDLRLLLVGALLPDIIDKPVGQYFFRDTFSNGRIFSHTFLFFILLAAIGFYLHRRGGHTWLLVLAFGTFTHLVLDQMWLLPRTLWWPLYGFTFDRMDLTGWGAGIWRVFFTDPAVYIPEWLGLAVLVWLALLILRRKRVLAFLRHGKI